MIRFECDYAEGAQADILKAIVDTNSEQCAGYGLDEHSENAVRLIKKVCCAKDAAVHLLSGGTQTNLIVIESVLRPYQGVISADTGHINSNEAGAIEATGHRIIPIKSNDGKLTAEMVENAVNVHYDGLHERTVTPGMVYISHPAENGVCYSLAELTSLSLACKKHGLPLFLDGARLGYALASKQNDLDLADIARLTDAFYIGGTKIGFLIGEAVVIVNPALQKDFRCYMKRRGALLAKGRLLGVQFERAFANDSLFYHLGESAVRLALKLRKAAEELGFSVRYNSVTNQQFIILPDVIIKKLQEKYSFYVWERVNVNHSVARFVTSWATPAENVEGLIADLTALSLA
jgi:Threonine aldolase